MVKQKSRYFKNVSLILLFLLLLSSLAGCAVNPSSSMDKPTNTYTPPINEGGYIVLTLPIGSTTKESDFWTDVTANEDGSFNYTFTPDQFQQAKEKIHLFGRFIDDTTSAYSAEYIKCAEYSDVDEHGIPWSLTVLVDKELYNASEPANSFYIRVNASVYMRMYQIFCGVPSDEWSVHVTIKDVENGRIISEHDFPAGNE